MAELSNFEKNRLQELVLGLIKVGKCTVSELAKSYPDFTEVEIERLIDQVAPMDDVPVNWSDETPPQIIPGPQEAVKDYHDLLDDDCF